MPAACRAGRRAAVAILICLPLLDALAQNTKPSPRPAAEAGIDVVIRDGFLDQRPDWRARLGQDQIQQLCSQYRNKPPRRVAALVQKRAKDSIVYPADGNLIGDWKRGEVIAQSGYGQRFTDGDATRPNGGNCYGCHRLDQKEASYGTLGADLAAYGRLHDDTAAAVRKVYDKIYNPHSINPCSAMPRFGASGTLSVEQIKDLVALVMARDSPVNR